MHDDEASSPGRQRGIRPFHIALAIGVVFAAVTATSGIVPPVTDSHDSSPITRPIFDGIPTALQVAFYTLIPVVLVYGAFLFALRVRNWERGAPDRRASTAKTMPKRLKDFRAGVYMQTLLRDPAAGVMHSM